MLSFLPAGSPASLPRACDDITRRVRALARTLGLPCDPFAPPEHRTLAGIVPVLSAQLLLTGTRTAAPLLEKECIQIARSFECDLILLRKEQPVDRNLAIFARRAQGEARRWHEGYGLRVHQHIGNLLISSSGAGPFWLVDHDGLAPLLERVCTPVATLPSACLTA